MTEKQEICENCGHDRAFHRHNWSGKNTKFWECEHSNCSCKKFKARTFKHTIIDAKVLKNEKDAERFLREGFDKARPKNHSPQEAKEFSLPKDVEHPHGVGAGGTYSHDSYTDSNGNFNLVRKPDTKEFDLSEKLYATFFYKKEDVREFIKIINKDVDEKFKEDLAFEIKEILRKRAGKNLSGDL